MGDVVRVESFDALRKFRAAFCKFAEMVGVAIDEAETEVLHTAMWVQQEQHDYWKRQLAIRTELYNRAKSVLNQKKIETTAMGGHYSCVDERKALAVAERKLEEAQQKQANVRRWSRLLEEESFTYQGLTQGVRIALQTEIPTALAQLDAMVAALESYAAARAPEMQGSVTPPGEWPGSADAPTMARAEAAGSAELAQHQALRAKTPPQELRDRTAIGAIAAAASAPPGEFAHQLAAMKDADLAPAPDDKVVLASGVLQSAHVYLERIAPTPGDSGWFVGYVDDATVDRLDAVRIADLLAVRPDWRDLLELPPGCLAIVAGASLEFLIDGQGRALTPAARGDA